MMALWTSINASFTVLSFYKNQQQKFQRLGHIPNCSFPLHLTKSFDLSSTGTGAIREANVGCSVWPGLAHYYSSWSILGVLFARARQFSDHQSPPWHLYYVSHAWMVIRITTCRQDNISCSDSIVPAILFPIFAIRLDPYESLSPFFERCNFDSYC